VLKIFKSNDIKRRKQKIAWEIRYLKGLEHSALPEFFKVFDKDGFYGFIMEKKSGHSLDEIMDFGGVFSKQEIISIIFQLIEAVEYLYASNIIHRDIKTTNILWDGKNLALIDLGSARNRIHLRKRYDLDIWSIGDVFMRLLLNSYNGKICGSNGAMSQLALSEKENILLQRMLYIKKPYSNVFELKAAFKMVFYST
jgi:serine/threonine protein kinase